MKEFNLSEKIGYVDDYHIVDEKDVHPATKQAVFEIEDVKEFIRILKEELKVHEKINPLICKRIDALAGEQLSK